ncbi:MAG: class I SAM-dependent methyltransferase [Anaerolineae bacterium]|nr:class I SAM-dependent methyltransferase [Anaerolineae bacterium]
MNPNAAFYERIAQYYDAENADMTDDLVMYGELAAETGGPVLDVGCGTGRVMLHLAQESYQVVGVDRSQAMLARAQRKLDLMPDLKRQVTIQQGDALRLTLTEQFRLILVTYNSFMQFGDQADQLAALRGFSRLLDDDGLLVMDLPNAAEAYATPDDNAVSLERMFIEPESGRLVMQQTVSELDRATQELDITWIYDEIGEDGTVRRTLAPLLLRYVFAAEMDLMLAAAGLRRVAYYGDYTREPFADGCPRMIVLAGKAEAAR